MKIFLTISIPVLLLISQLGTAQSNKFTLSGQIKDAENGEDLISVSIYVPALQQGTVSNLYGFYSLTLEEGIHNIVVSYLGYKSQHLTLELNSNIRRQLDLKPDVAVLNEVVVSADRNAEDHNISSTQMGATTLRVEAVKKIPALLGEVDIIKAIQLLPGVHSIGEGGSGFYVRGGTADQNLILLDEAPIYHASHLLGFFSSFNPDAIKDMQFYRAAIPANYGGRLSSVLDIRMKEGNARRLSVAGGIGSIMSRVALESPLGNRGSFMVAGRRSYLDILAKAFADLRGNRDSLPGGSFYFYDLNAKANYHLSENDRIFMSGYFGRDVVKAPDDGVNVAWGNKTGTIRWNHLFSPKIFSNLTYYYSNYDYFLEFGEDLFLLTWKSRLKEHGVKADMGMFLNPRNTLKLGLHGIRHEIWPGNIASYEGDELIDKLNMQKRTAYQSALYIYNEQKINDRLKINYGIRLSTLHNIGPQDAVAIDDQYHIHDTIHHPRGVFNRYWNIEPRISARYRFNRHLAIKASYNRTVQYIQQASNGNSATPFDIWFLTSESIKPQLADQYSIGIFRNLREHTIEFSAEIYYKRFLHAIDFADHAQLLLNENLEADLRVGSGRAYGLELLAKKEKGRFTGWVGYTLSKAEKKIRTINNGQWYNTKFDKPHDFSLVLAYDLSSRLSLGSNFVYSTGSPTTFPTGRYVFEGVSVPVYSERNGSRLPDYHRLDLSATLQSKRNKNRRLQTEWVLSIYNAYNRRNAFSIDFKQEESNANQTYAEKSSVFSIVPALTFNAKF